MKRFCLAVFSIFIFSVTNIHAQKNWTPLFDGTTLTGWKQMTGKATFRAISRNHHGCFGSQFSQ